MVPTLSELLQSQVSLTFPTMSVNKPSNTRVSLSKSQLEEGIGAELFSLCQASRPTGGSRRLRLSLLAIGLTLTKTPQLPGVALLTDMLKRIIADGKVTRDEQRDLMEAIEKVLPPDARKGAKAARKLVEKQRKDAEKAAAKASKEREREQELERYHRREPEDDFDFMVAGVHADGRHSIISRYLSVGDRVRLIPEPTTRTMIVP